MKLLIAILSLVPKNLISALTGIFAESKLPQFLLTPLIRAYVSFYNVELDEVEKSLSDFRTLSDFFVRDLKEGSRPLDIGFCSPADGSLVAMEKIASDSMVQAKGMHYSLRDFLVLENLAQPYQNGSSATIYLSPKDYHNVHMPVSAYIKRAVLVPGKLWPVNSWSVNNIQSLFSVNERIILECEADSGDFLLVLVGATNVGSIRLEFSSMRGNASRKFNGGKQDERSNSIIEEFDNLFLEKGAKLGSFYLGSTVILVFKENSFVPIEAELPLALRYGNQIGELSPVGETSKS